MSWLRDILGLPSGQLLRERLYALGARPHPCPIFPFGNQKAGGTAIAGLLSAATGLRATLDLAGTTAPHFGRLIRNPESLDRFVLANAWAFSAPIVKDGNLTFVAEPLMDHFGVERAIFILRNPFDNIRSILNRLKIPGNLNALDPKTIRANATWRAILSGEDLGLPPDQYIATLARRWLRAIQVYERSETRFVRIRYEDFRNNKTVEIRKLAHAFNLQTPNDISHLLDHEFQRHGHPDIDLRDFFGAENMARIEEICGDAAARQGYCAP